MLFNGFALAAAAIALFTYFAPPTAVAPELPCFRDPYPGQSTGEYLVDNFCAGDVVLHFVVRTGKEGGRL